MSSEPEEIESDPDTAEAISAEPQSRGILLVALLAWILIGLFLLESPNPPAFAATIDPLLSHVILFFWIAFAGLGAFIGGAARPLRKMIIGLAAVVGFAAATEIVQSALDFGRTGDKQDFIADCIGAGIAAVLITVLLVAVSRAKMVRMVSIASLGALTLLVVAAIFGADLQTRAECFNVDSQLLSDDGLSPLVRVRPGEGSYEDHEGQQSYSGGATPMDGERLRCGVARTQAFTVVVTITPDNVQQTGPTRIVTSSAGIQSDEVNFHLGQEGSDLSVRLRPGPVRNATILLVENVFEANVLTTIAFAYSDGVGEVYKDGILIEVLEFEADSLLGWDATYPLVIGDESTGDRTYEGEIHEVAIFTAALDESEVRPLG